MHMNSQRTSLNLKKSGNGVRRLNSVKEVQMPRFQTTNIDRSVISRRGERETSDWRFMIMR